jgi:pimeloyl-ACP methyl ester carboxylesterase
MKLHTSLAEVELPEGFTSELLATNGCELHYVRGGDGPAVILIHGFPQDWFEYQSIMRRLAKRFTVIAIDLRGIGGSTVKTGSYDAANMAEDVYQLMAALKLMRVYVVGHDIGGMVAYALTRRYPDAIRGAMILDAALPGVAGWEETQGHPAFWHVQFMQVPRLPEELVQGRQAAYFNYFFGFGKFSPQEADHYVSAYHAPAQLHALFEMYRAFPANAQFNAMHRGPVNVPLFLATGDGSPFASLVPKMAHDLRSRGFADVKTGTIRASVHYLLQDQPEAVAEIIEQHA